MDSAHGKPHLRPKRILYVQYTNPGGYPPLEHGSRILANAGWEVMFLGTGAEGAAALRFPPHPSVRVRSMGFCRAGLWQKLHFLAYMVWVLGWVMAWRPRWVYASDVLSCPIAYLVGRLQGVRVAYHEHDLPGPAKGVFQRLYMRARSALSRRADLCVLPNHRRAKFFADETGRTAPIASIWNCPRADEIGPSRAPHEGGGLWVLYHGSIVPERLPMAVIAALVLLPPRVCLRIVGYETAGSRGYVDRLKWAAQRVGVHDRMACSRAVPTRRELLSVARSCDIGLAFMPRTSEDANMRYMTGASNKPFDYLACGLALLVSDLPDWREMYVDPGYGLACDPQDPVSIAAALTRFLHGPSEMRAMGEAGRRRVTAEWNYETQFRPVQEHLETAQ